MNIEELLTYIEELTFKSSMFGYDRDEVDTQLDAICEKVEALVREKDAKIKELEEDAIEYSRQVAPGFASGISDLEEETEEKAEAEQVNQDQTETETVAEADQDEDATVEELKKELAEMEKALRASETRCKEAEGRIVEMEDDMDILNEELDRLNKALKDKGPTNKDEAYHLYMKNADLLCKQLNIVQMQTEAALKDANEKATMILEDAEAEATTKLAKAQTEANQIKLEAQELADLTVEEAQRKADTIGKQCDAMKEQKTALLTNLQSIGTQFQTFMDDFMKNNSEGE